MYLGPEMKVNKPKYFLDWAAFLLYLLELRHIILKWLNTNSIYLFKKKEEIPINSSLFLSFFKKLAN